MNVSIEMQHTMHGEPWRVIVHAENSACWFEDILWSKNPHTGENWECKDPLFVIGRTIKRVNEKSAKARGG
jgi:hypothetical protein